MMENRIMAAATSRNTSSTPSSTMPPAIPNTPDRNELTTMVAPIRAKVRIDISGWNSGWVQGSHDGALWDDNDRKYNRKSRSGQGPLLLVAMALLLVARARHCRRAYA